MPNLKPTIALAASWLAGAAPAVAFDAALVRPGHASWSWALLKDDATVYEVQKKFID